MHSLPSFHEAATAGHEIPWDDCPMPMPPQAIGPIHEVPGARPEMPPVSYTGRSPEGRPQTVEEFLRTDTGKTTRQQLRHCWEAMLTWAKADTRDAEHLRKLLWLLVDRPAQSVGFDACRQASLMGHGKRSLEILLPLVRKLPVAGQQTVATQLLQALKEHDVDPARVIRNCLTNLHLKLSREGGSADVPVPQNTQVTRQLWVAVKELLQGQGWAGNELTRRTTTQTHQLLDALGLFALPQNLGSEVRTLFAPHDMAWLALKADALV